MKIKCTDEQVIKMALAAINASIPAGLGWMHAKPGDIKLEDAKLEIVEDFGGHSLHVDYYEGRMVKFHARKISDGEWSFNPDEITSDYQSWKRKYYDYRELFNAISEEPKNAA